MTCVVIACIGWVLASLFSSLVWLLVPALAAFAIFYGVFMLLLLVAFFSKSSGLAIMYDHGKVDSKYLPLLVDFSKETLLLACLEIEHGCDWFTRSMASMIGGIERVGLISSLLALMALIAVPEKIPSWAYPLIAIGFLLYMAALALHSRFVRFDRLLALTQLAIKLKDNKKS